MATVMILDDHPVARFAIRKLLDDEGHQIIAEGDDGMQGLLAIRQQQPDVVIVDIDIHSLNGIDLTERLRHQGYTGRVLVFSSRDARHYISRCRQAGANGFLSKRNHLEQLTDAVKALLRDYAYFPFSTDSHEDSPEEHLIAMLSGREFQVLTYLARGMRLVDIAGHMHVSTKTVSTYKSRLLQKLALNQTIELINFAHRHNIN
ncbi:response regulator [Shimwellia pseudoproteus]|uniref:response regulator n=1 Tax=Shimwellia pseudoproteus TaxID=570012 RepID=UPI0018EA705C|nr:response regulator [Shimwellia pseudoproteus]MBJ3815690.1 response regulator [Shimwellia pseudoproteus]